MLSLFNNNNNYKYINYIYGEYIYSMNLHNIYINLHARIITHIYINTCK